MVSVLVASGLCLPRALRLLSPLLGMASPRMGLAALVVVNATSGGGLVPTPQCIGRDRGDLTNRLEAYHAVPSNPASIDLVCFFVFLKPIGTPRNHPSGGNSGGNFPPPSPPAPPAGASSPNHGNREHDHEDQHADQHHCEEHLAHTAEMFSGGLRSRYKCISACGRQQIWKRSPWLRITRRTSFPFAPLSWSAASRGCSGSGGAEIKPPILPHRLQRAGGAVRPLVSIC